MDAGWRRPCTPLPPAPGPAEWDAYLSVHAKSFWAASRLMNGARRTQLLGVYAYCRYTDDLVDKGSRTRDELLALLDRWEILTRAAYIGQTTGVPLLDHVMHEMARHDVPLAYALALLRGMRQDAIGARFASMPELRGYCYDVASVVGLWLTELFGVHDTWTLERAAELGIAMQLTNIARDVGEDWRHGRLYLPRDLMDAHGITASMIDRWVRERNGKVPVAYAALIEELMQSAEDAYARAAEAIPKLPEFFQPAVATASRLYAAIHEVIRQNGYDNLTKRAVVPIARRLAR
jgi:phytoene synthase